MRRDVALKQDDVPQDVARALVGQRKALYATDERGAYRIVRSAGWEAEEIVLDQAIAECEQLTAAAHARALRGEASPLEYHMCRCRMDVLVLAQSTGFFKWQVRRHLRPASFQRLSAARRARYANALGIDLQELGTLPDRP